MAAFRGFVNLVGVGLLALHLLGIQSTEAKSATGPRVLAILNDKGQKTAFSQLFSGLKSRGFSVEYKLVNEDKILLRQYKAQKYDHVIAMAPTAYTYGGVDSTGLKDFVAEGGNVFMMVNHTASPLNRNFATEFGVDFHDKDTRVIDHFNVDNSDDGGHTRVITNQMTTNKHLVGKLGSDKGGSAISATNSYILYDGIAHSINEDSVLIHPVLAASDTGYSAKPGKVASSSLEAAGSDVLLASGVQTRTNSRVTFLGSLWTCSDDARKRGVKAAHSNAKKDSSDNSEFCDSLLSWTFQEEGVLRTDNTWHARIDGSPPEHLLKKKKQEDLPKSMFSDPELARQSLVYRAKDDLRYSIDILQWDGSAGKWTPYIADDVQLEFVMLDPYVRTTMKPSSNGTYTGTFKAPDQHGIYKFRVMYRRPALTVLKEEDVVSVRPFWHNEFERFITTAYPYYAAGIMTMIGFVVTGYIFLYTEDKAV
eukprot:gb/GECG01008258.1/.p1 GENE.gb/GECG01008258.1/~~gb/GECG01008258.1/.p1  ORF type:complete len:479 (+),score=57.05 gb/GECG01008258.1/:1-1437(+)